ncbi:MAG: hypothetical protein Q8L35_03765, partial [Actinomycetota bacterium]|nr:hypothetical protein [Actinomycetota bacterium]
MTTNKNADNGHKGKDMTSHPIIILCSIESCPSAGPASKGEIDDAPLKAFVSAEDGYFVIDCPELSIHVSDTACEKAHEKLELAIMDYYQVLVDLPEKFMGEVQRHQLMFYEETLIPAIGKYLAERGE